MLRPITKDYHGYMSMARKNTPDMLLSNPLIFDQLKNRSKTLAAAVNFQNFA